MRGERKSRLQSLSVHLTDKHQMEIPSPPDGRPLPPKFELRPLTTLSCAELQEATTMLAYAFDEHPLFRLAFPKAASRSMILQTLFATVLKDAIRFGRVDVACSHKIVGMLIWYPPGCYPMSKSRILRLLPHYVRLVAVSPVGPDRNRGHTCSGRRRQRSREAICRADAARADRAAGRYRAGRGVLGVGRVALGHRRYAGGFGGLGLRRSRPCARGRADRKMSMIASI
jgi:hypothetical protein